MAGPLYRGYSSVVNDKIDTSLFNIELVKQDLRNHFQTRLGERRGRPEFGSIIHELIFDLLDTRTESLIYADARRIFNSDPRVEVQSLKVEVSPDQGEVKLEAILNFKEFNMDEKFIHTFQVRD